MSSVSFEFFEGLDIRVFYRELGRGLVHAVLAAVRREDGWEVEVEDGDPVRVRFRDPKGEPLEFQLRAGEIPRAWWWWDPPPWRRSWTITWDAHVVEGPMLSDREVFCDTCGHYVLTRPVPVVDGYALCGDCFEVVVGIPIQTAASWDGVTLSTLDEEEIHED